MNRIASFAKKRRSNPREKLLSYHLLFLVNNNFVTIKQRWCFSIGFIIPEIVRYSWVEQTRSWHACDMGGFCAPFLFIVWLIWNRSTLLLTSKLNEFLKKIKQKQQKQQQQQSYIKVLLGSSCYVPKVYFCLNKHWVSTLLQPCLIRLVYALCHLRFDGLACCRQCLLSLNL